MNWWQFCLLLLSLMLVSWLLVTLLFGLAIMSVASHAALIVSAARRKGDER